MKFSPSAFVLAAVAFAAMGGSWVRGAATFEEIRPLLDTYCFECHGKGKKKGGLALDGYKSGKEAAKDHKTWELVLDNLRQGVMPPDDVEKQPTLEEKEKIMGWINAAVFAVDPDKPDPGRVTIRRLNRTEYNNTIRDLVGVDFEPGADFPADDSGYGFDNIGDVLSLPPVLFDRYLNAAEKIMSEAILNDHKPRSERIRVDLMKIEGGPKNGSTPSSRRIDEAESTVKIALPVPGEYELRLEVMGNRVGGDVTKLDLKWNGKDLLVPSLSGNRDHPDRLKLKVRVEEAGTATLSLRVGNPLAKPEMRDGRERKRTVTVRKLELMSPPKKVTAPETQARLFAPGRGQKTIDGAARAIIETFAKRAFRRPVSKAEVDRFFWIYAQTAKRGGNFEQSVQTALTAVLVSPHFLFRGELQPEPDNPKAVHEINEYALASRLSYFLWSTMPDEALFAEAERKTLRKNLPAIVKRMLADAKAQALVENFAGQWLQIRNLEQVQPDRRTFEAWDKGLAAAMARETEMLFEHIMREDRSVLEILGADYTFVNERLARHYGIGGVEGDAFVKVKLPGNRPGGVLGHGSFLTLTSNPTRTSPVKRGKFVLENLLGTPPPPAPPDVPDIEDKSRGELKGTLRQRLEKHREDPTCASCHARMDPIGFGLENFDGIGAWREKDGDALVDSAGELVSGEKFSNAVELRGILLNQKRTDFLRCLTEKMLTYALGRGLEYYDRPAVEKIVAGMEKDGAKFSSLILEVVRSVPFQMRRGEGDPRTAAEAAKRTAER